MAITGRITVPIVRSITGSLVGDSAPAGPQAPAFHALTPDPITHAMRGVLLGAGDLTPSHTAAIYQPDHEGVYQKFPANAPVWKGARCVLTGAAGSDVSAVYGDDGAGTPLPEVPKLYAAPAATNKMNWSRNFADDALWKLQVGATRLGSIVGLDGTAGTGQKISSDNAQVFAFIYRVNTISATNPSTVVMYTRISETNSTLALIGQADSVWYAIYNPQTKAVLDSSGISAVEIVNSGDVQKVMVTPSMAITDRVVIHPNRNKTSQYLGLLQVEIHEGKSIAQVRDLGPIFTTTAAASTDKTVYSFDVANNAANCAWYFEAQSSVAQAVLDGFVSIVGSDWQLNDGTTAITRPWTADTMQKVGIVAYGAFMAIKVGSTWSADVAYDGMLLQGILDLFRTVDMGPAYMRDLRRYDISSLQAGKDVIDGLSP